MGRFTGLLITVYALALVGATYFVAAWLVRLPEVTESIDRATRMAGRLPVLDRWFGRPT
jgi:hypothetical protein